MPPSIYDFLPPGTREQAGYAGLGALAQALLAGGAPTTTPGGGLAAMGQGLGGFSNAYNARLNAGVQQAALGMQLAKAQREEDQQKAWQAAFGLAPPPNAPQMASADPNATAGALTPMPGDRSGPTPAAANRLNTGAASPVGMIPANMRPLVAMMGPEKGAAFLAQMQAKNMETGQWEDLGNGIQRNKLTGEQKPISPKLVEANINPTITMPPQRKAEDEVVGKKFGEIYIDLQNGAMSAGGRLAKLDRLDSLLGKTYTGAGAEAVQSTNRALKAAGDAMGLDTSGLNEQIGAGEAAKALAGEMALQLRNPAGGAGMPGAMSDQDRAFLQSMVPGLGMTPEGRKQIIETQRRLIQREKDVAQLARDYRRANGSIDEGFFDKLQQFSEKNPLFADMKPVAAPAPTGGPKIGSVEGGYRFKGGNPADKNSWEKVQ